MEFLLSPEIWMAFLTLTALELVLGIDNVIFISIVVDRVAPEIRERVRKLGLFLAMFMRIALLVVLSSIVGMTEPVFSLAGYGFSGKDVVLILGGLFLVWKSTTEIHQLMEGAEDEPGKSKVFSGVAAVVAQIIVIDLVFSLDSIITAVGMVNQIPVMAAAVIASVFLMMCYAKMIGDFVSDHPTIKMLALSFLVVVGVVLLAEGFGHHVPKGYIYFAMAFSVIVEMMNIRMRKKGEPVKLHSPMEEESKN